MAHRVDGEIITLVADAGEFDGDWTDPAVVQRALFIVVEGLRRAAPTLDPHLVVALSTFTVEAPAALYLPLANDVRGIGYRHLEPAEVFRFTPGRLDGVIFMNTVRAADAPLTEALFLQELGHRWGVYVRLPEPDGTRLLGRDCAHWSHFVRTDGSALEGNPWVEGAPGRFSADVPPSVGYDPAQLYLMGALPAAEVPAIEVVSPVGGPCSAAVVDGEPNPRVRPPTWRSGVPALAEGPAAQVPWQAVVDHEGPRAPAWPEARTGWSVLFVLLARSADDPSAAIPAVDGARARWGAAFEAATHGALTLHTTRAAAALDPAPGSVDFGGRCLDPADCVVDWPLCVPTESGDRVCSAPCAAHTDCGVGACCVAVGVEAVCAPSVDPCPAVDLDDGGVAADHGVDASEPDAAALDATAPDGATVDAGLPDAAPDAGPAGGARAGCAVPRGSAYPVAWPLLVLLVLCAVRRR